MPRTVRRSSCFEVPVARLAVRSARLLCGLFFCSVNCLLDDSLIEPQQEGDPIDRKAFGDHPVQLSFDVLWKLRFHGLIIPRSRI